MLLPKKKPFPRENGFVYFTFSELNSFDVRAKRFQSAIDVFIATIDLLDIVDD